MANISTDFSTWSGTAASNQPDSGDTATIQADLQAIQAALRTIFPSVNAAVLPTHTELNYVDGVTSAIQTQLNAKAATGANGDITSLTACTSITAGTVTVATGDLVYVQDVSAANVLKVVTAQSIANLASVSAATTTSSGIVELATTAEMAARTDTTRAVTPESLQGILVSGTKIDTTSGSSQQFSSIPSWVKRIQISLSGVSTNGSAVLQLQIGDSGGLETTGYLGAHTVIGSGSGITSNLTSGFGIPGAAAASIIHGIAIITLIDAATNTWAYSFTGALSNIANTIWAGGSKSLSATLDRVALVTTDTFDAGMINILYD